MEEHLYQAQIESLRKIVECPICLDILDADVLSCTNGHTFCQKCKENLEICPSCQQPVADTQLNLNFIVCQMFEILKSSDFCQFCKKLIKSNNTHNKYCGQRITKCKVQNCSWTGIRKNVLQHVKNKHDNMIINIEMNKRTLCMDHYEKKYRKLSLLSITGQIFWREAYNNSTTGLLTITYHYVPCGEIKTKLYATEIYTSEDNEYRTKLRLNLDPTINNYKNNSFTILTTMAQKFVNDHKILTFEIEISKV